ncbi:MAG: orotate phosphoribosyltransferase [Myxococcota bacterium]|nr:orotate phosphoribosyltransferase [Myxococcota bacterium]
MMQANRTRLLEILTHLSYQQREVTLASGKKSNFYIDCKQTTLSAEGQILVGRLLYAKIRDYQQSQGISLAGVGGLTLGADPIATAISMTSALAGDPINAFIVRKEPKGHGTGAWLEGCDRFAEGSEVIVVEDVATTGGSALKAVRRVRDAGYKVRLVLGLVDRLEGGRAAIEAEDLEFFSLFDRTDFPQ